MDVSDKLQGPDRITSREKPSVPVNRGDCGLWQTPTHKKCIIVQTTYKIFGPYPLADLDVDGTLILKCVVQEEVRELGGPKKRWTGKEKAV